MAKPSVAPRARETAWPISGELLCDIDLRYASDREVLEGARKWARLSLLATSGLLTTAHGSLLEEADIDLLQQVAYVTAQYAAAAAHRFVLKAVA